MAETRRKFDQDFREGAVRLRLEKAELARERDDLKRSVALYKRRGVAAAGTAASADGR